MKVWDVCPAAKFRVPEVGREVGAGRGGPVLDGVIHRGSRCRRTGTDDRDDDRAVDSLAADSHDWNWIWFATVNGAEAAKISVD